MTRTKQLRDAVKERFFPYAESRRFVREKSAHPHFTTFRRIDGHKVRVFNVQWDKYGHPRFVLNFGEGPLSGVILWGKHKAGQELEPQDCPESGRLQRRKGGSLRCWFQLNKPLLDVIRTMEWRYPPEAVVNELLSAFPELEAWWEHRTVGPHIDLSSSDLWRLANAPNTAG